MGEDFKEKRQHPRFIVKIYGIFKSDIDLEETDMMMGNLSAGGAYIKTDNPSMPGSTVTLRFHLPGEEKPISASGVVVWWQKPGGGKEPGMGVKFEKINDEDLEKLKKYLESLVEEELFGKKE